MKIEFEKIIESANKRKVRLENLTKLMDSAEEHMSDLVAALGWFEAIQEEMRWLDQEGKMLIPPVTRNFFEYASQYKGALKEMIHRVGTGGSEWGLQAAIEETNR